MPSHTAIRSAASARATGAGAWPATVNAARALAAERIAVWDGNYYAVEAMRAYGIEGAVRAGIAAYLTVDDVDRLLAAVARL